MATRVYLVETGEDYEGFSVNLVTEDMGDAIKRAVDLESDRHGYIVVTPWFDGTEEKVVYSAAYERYHDRYSRRI